MVLYGGSGRAADEKKEEKVPPALNFKMNDIDGKPLDLAKFQGKVVVFVNVASY
jgi:glutathione peroxidase